MDRPANGSGEHVASGGTAARRRAAAVAGSVLAHLAVLWLAVGGESRVAPIAPAAVGARVRSPDTAPPAQALDVVLLEPAEPPAIEVAVPSHRSNASRNPSRSRTEPAPSEADPALPHGTGMLAMRAADRIATDDSRGHGSAVDLRATDQVLDRVVAKSGVAPAPAEVVRSGRLESKGGETTIRDAVATVRVDPDGAAHITSKPDIDVEFNLNPMRIADGLRAFGADIAAWSQDPEARKRYGRTQDLPQHLRATPGGCDQFADRMCDDVNQAHIEPTADAHLSAARAGFVSIISGKLDLTAYLARRFNHEDVYSARKRKLLDATRDERAEIGARYRSERLAAASQLMLDNLAWLKAHAKSPAELRAGAFALWDDCAEGDGPIGEAGGRARAMVLGFIRTALARDTPAMFTPEEIARLDEHRVSTQHFAPYE